MVTVPLLSYSLLGNVPSARPASGAGVGRRVVAWVGTIGRLSLSPIESRNIALTLARWAETLPMSTATHMKTPAVPTNQRMKPSPIWLGWDHNTEFFEIGEIDGSKPESPQCYELDEYRGDMSFER